MSDVRVRSLRPRIGRTLDPSLQASLVIPTKDDEKKPVANRPSSSTEKMPRTIVRMKQHSLRSTSNLERETTPNRPRQARKPLMSASALEISRPIETHRNEDIYRAGQTSSDAGNMFNQSLFSLKKPVISNDILNRIVEQNSIIIQMMKRQSELEQRHNNIQPVTISQTIGRSSRGSTQQSSPPEFEPASIQEDIQVDTSHNNRFSESESISRQSIKRESSVDAQENNQKRRTLNLPTVKRRFDGTFTEHAKLLEIGRCAFPPTNLNTPKALFERMAIFQSILKRYRDHETDLARQRSRYKYNGFEPRVCYAIHSFKNTQQPDADFSVRAYCSARKKHECPATVILDYKWSEQTYRFYKCFKHNHRLDCGLVKWDAILEKEVDNIPNVEVLVSKFSKGIDEIKIKQERCE